jgi:hypothetical protein
MHPQDVLRGVCQVREYSFLPRFQGFVDEVVPFVSAATFEIERLLFTTSMSFERLEIRTSFEHSIEMSVAGDSRKGYITKK